MPKFMRLKQEIEDGTLQTRRTRSHFLIAGNYDHNSEERVRFIRKKNGAIELKWSGHVQVETEKTEECDLGHSHKVKVSREFVWNYCRLSEKDIKSLIEFLREGRGD